MRELFGDLQGGTATRRLSRRTPPRAKRSPSRSSASATSTAGVSRDGGGCTWDWDELKGVPQAVRVEVEGMGGLGRGAAHSHPRHGRTPAEPHTSKKIIAPEPPRVAACRAAPALQATQAEAEAPRVGSSWGRGAHARHPRAPASLLLFSAAPTHFSPSIPGVASSVHACR